MDRRGRRPSSRMARPIAYQQALPLPQAGLIGMRRLRCRRPRTRPSSRRRWSRLQPVKPGICAPKLAAIVTGTGTECGDWNREL